MDRSDSLLWNPFFLYEFNNPEMGKFPKLPASVVRGLITECKLEIVQSGKIPKGQAVLVYNPALAREGKGGALAREGKGGKGVQEKGVKGGHEEGQGDALNPDPAVEFKALAQTEKVRDKIVNYLVAAGILESASGVISNARVAMHKTPMEGISDMMSNVLGYSDKKRSMDQEKRVVQIVRVREYLEKLVDEKRRAAGDDAAKKGGADGLRAKDAVGGAEAGGDEGGNEVGGAEAGGDEGGGVKVNEDSNERTDGIQADNKDDNGDGDGGGYGNGIDFVDFW